MSTSYKTTGTIVTIDETKQISDRFRKREFVLEIADGKYPQTVQFQTTGDRCELLDSYQEGDELTVEFNLRGREWRSPKGEIRYFNTLDAWKLEGQARGGQRRGGAHEQPSQTYSGGGGGPDDEIPF